MALRVWRKTLRRAAALAAGQVLGDDHRRERGADVDPLVQQRGRVADGLLGRAGQDGVGHAQEQPAAIGVARLHGPAQQQPAAPRAAQQVGQVVAAQVALLGRQQDRVGQDGLEHPPDQRRPDHHREAAVLATEIDGGRRGAAPAAGPDPVARPAPTAPGRQSGVAGSWRPARRRDRRGSRRRDRPAGPDGAVPTSRPVPLAATAAARTATAARSEARRRRDGGAGVLVVRRRGRRARPGGRGSAGRSPAQRLGHRRPRTAAGRRAAWPAARGSAPRGPPRSRDCGRRGGSGIAEAMLRHDRHRRPVNGAAPAADS